MYFGCQMEFRNSTSSGIINLAPIIFIMLSLGLTNCNRTSTPFNEQAYRDEMKKWQERRIERIGSDDGWLTLCGLFWLKEDENTFGSDSTNEIILPSGKAPAIAGSLLVERGMVRLESRKGVETKVHDSIVTYFTLRSDEDGLADPTIVKIGSLSFYLIKRADKLGVRVKDKEHTSRLQYKGLEFFPIDLKWRIEARFEEYKPPKILSIATMINTVEQDSCPGVIVFQMDGKTHRLDVVLERGTENKFFLMFSDETSGKETYGMGRQLYTELPDKDNTVLLDFNKAYNWPCVYTDYATCPIPPPQNKLKVRVEAGEKNYPVHK